MYFYFFILLPIYLIWQFVEVISISVEQTFWSWSRDLSFHPRDRDLYWLRPLLRLPDIPPCHLFPSHTSFPFLTFSFLLHISSLFPLHFLDPTPTALPSRQSPVPSGAVWCTWCVFSEAVRLTENSWLYILKWKRMIDFIKMFSGVVFTCH